MEIRCEGFIRLKLRLTTQRRGILFQMRGRRNEFRPEPLRRNTFPLRRITFSLRQNRFFRPPNTPLTCKTARIYCPKHKKTAGPTTNGFYSGAATSHTVTAPFVRQTNRGGCAADTERYPNHDPKSTAAHPTFGYPIPRKMGVQGGAGAVQNVTYFFDRAGLVHVEIVDHLLIQRERRRLIPSDRKPPVL